MSRPISGHFAHLLSGIHENTVTNSLLYITLVMLSLKRAFFSLVEVT